MSRRPAIPTLEISTFDPGSGTGPMSLNNQEYAQTGAMAALAHAGYDLQNINPAVATIAMTHPHELANRILADSLGDVQKRNLRKDNGKIVGEATPHSVRDAYDEFNNRAFNFAARIALTAGLLVGGAVTYDNVESQHQPTTAAHVTAEEVAGGVVVGAVTGLLTFIPTIAVSGGGKAVRRRARRELSKQLKSQH